MPVKNVQTGSMAISGGTATATVQLFGLIRNVFVDEGSLASHTITITDASGMDVLNGAGGTGVDADRHITQADMGGTAVAGACTVTITAASGTATNVNIYVVS